MGTVLERAQNRSWLWHGEAIDFWEIAKLSPQTQRGPGALPPSHLAVGDTQQCVSVTSGTAQGDLLHIFTCLVFPSMVWMCPWVEQMLGPVGFSL